MNRITKTLLMVHDDFHEQLRLVMPCARRVDMLLPPLPSDMEVEHVTAQETLTLNQFHRVVEVFPESGDPKITAELTVNRDTCSGDLWLRVNDANDVHFQEHVIENGLQGLMQFVHHPEHDVTVQVTAVDPADMTGYPPPNALIAVSVDTTGGIGTVSGQLRRNDPYPEVFEQLRSHLVHPAVPLSSAFSPQVAGALLGLRGTKLLPDPAEPDHILEILSMVLSLVCDLKCGPICTKYAAFINHWLLELLD